jgi:hypothetical protein
MRRGFKMRGLLSSGVPSEEWEHIAVVAYLRYQYPDALYTIAPSGNALARKTANRFKAMGYRAGTPDIMIFEPRGGFCGLFIEMKVRKGGRVSEEQEAFIEALRARGYFAFVAFGADEAKKTIDAYMKGGINAGNHGR